MRTRLCEGVNFRDCVLHLLVQQLFWECVFQLHQVLRLDLCQANRSMFLDHRWAYTDCWLWHAREWVFKGQSLPAFAAEIRPSPEPFINENVRESTSMSKRRLGTFTTPLETAGLDTSLLSRALQSLSSSPRIRCTCNPGSSDEGLCKWRQRILSLSETPRHVLANDGD